MLTDDPVQGWRVRATAGPVPRHLEGLEVPAQVPGTAHTDLLAAGLIDDPYVDLGEEALVWAHRTQWLLLARARAAGAGGRRRAGGPGVRRPRHGGRDQPGRRRGREHAEPCTAATGSTCARLPDAAGPQQLEVAVPVGAGDGRGRAGAHRARPGAYPHPLNMVRKMACSFGWDWGPDLQTAGIWKPVTARALAHGTDRVGPPAGHGGRR